MSAFASLFGKETIIGLDIGSATLKAVQVESHKHGFRIMRAAQQKTPIGAVRDGIIVDRPAVSFAIKEMLKAANISATGAVTAISGPTVTVRQIKLPKMSEAALKKSVRYEAGKYITSNIEDSAIAFEIMGPAEDEPDQMNVMLVAAPKEMVESRVATVEAAGLEAVAVDMEAFSLQRSVVDCNRFHFDDGGLRALVDIGAVHTEVTILSGPRFELTRSLPIAGDTFTDAVRNQLRIGLEDAEQRKIDANLELLVRGGGTPEELAVPKSFQSILDELLREIRRSINYYQSQLPQGAEPQPLSELVLSGGSSRMQGIASYMTARLGTSVRVAEPLDSPLFTAATAEAEPWLKYQAPRLGVVLGLAIKETIPATLTTYTPAASGSAVIDVDDTASTTGSDDTSGYDFEDDNEEATATAGARSGN